MSGIRDESLTPRCKDYDRGPSVRVCYESP